MSRNRVIILGGGVAGLAAGYYLTKRNRDVVVFESQAVPGGNCRTIERDGFCFDTGAHRFHDKNREITEDLIELLDPDINRVQAPSMIFDNDRLINFPIQLADVFGKMSVGFAISAASSLAKARVLSRRQSSFEDFAIRSYGKLMSERFLLNYSEKLWGIPCSEVSLDIAGKRLKGIGLLTLLLSFVSKAVSQRAHYEGEFLYPVGGIQRVSDKLVAAIGKEKVLTGSKVTGISWRGDMITRIETSTDTVDTDDDAVVSTLPLPSLIAMMKPAVPESISSVATSLRFRNIRLAAFALNRERVNACATMYFPDKKYLFTRLYEPRNRYRSMSPQGKTMLVAEVPCFPEERIWLDADEDFIDVVKTQILATGLMKEEEIIASYSERMDNAYPVLEKSYAEKTVPILEYLSGFRNLFLSGRNSLFRYSWIHDMFQEGKLLADQIGCEQLDE